MIATMSAERTRIIRANDVLKEGVVPEKGTFDPLNVVRTTGINLNLHLYGEIDRQPIDSFFRDITLPHLDFVKEAVNEYFDPDSPKIYNNRIGTLSTSQLSKEDEYARASVDLYSVIFSAIPSQFHNPIMENGFSRNGYMKPPSSSKEMTDRVCELKDTLRGFMYGEYTTKNLSTVNLNSPAVRTYAFFKVGSELPIHMPNSKHESEQLSAEMIKDIDIDLPPPPKSAYQIEQEALAKEREAARNKEITLFENFLKDINIDLD